jgi:NADH:ubiquinone oxidoreductase subunit 4 (subunit M)
LGAFSCCDLSLTFVSSFLCNADQTCLIAFSSVARTGVVIGGILTLSYCRVLWLFTLMISHSLFIPGLFRLVNISYGRLSSSSLSINNKYYSNNKIISSKTKATNKAQEKTYLSKQKHK